MIKMEADFGIWSVSKGKGDRYYINCSDGSNIAHPEDIFGNNGMCIYNYGNLQSLAAAILMFEKQKQTEESIINKLNK